MEKDRDQLTPAEPDDAEHLERTRGQGTGGTGRDELPTEQSAPGASSGGDTDPSHAEGLPNYEQP